MKTDGLDWMDWLHQVRRRSEEERQHLGLSYAERLAKAEQVADDVVAGLAVQPTFTHDEPG